MDFKPQKFVNVDISDDNCLICAIDFKEGYKTKNGTIQRGSKRRRIVRDKTLIGHYADIKGLKLPCMVCEKCFNLLKRGIKLLDEYKKIRNNVQMKLSPIHRQKILLKNSPQEPHKKINVDKCVVRSFSSSKPPHSLRTLLPKTSEVKKKEYIVCDVTVVNGKVIPHVRKEENGYGKSPNIKDVSLSKMSSSMESEVISKVTNVVPEIKQELEETITVEPNIWTNLQVHPPIIKQEPSETSEVVAEEYLQSDLHFPSSSVKSETPFIEMRESLKTNYFQEFSDIKDEGSRFAKQTANTITQFSVSSEQLVVSNTQECSSNNCNDLPLIMECEEMKNEDFYMEDKAVACRICGGNIQSTVFKGNEILTCDKCEKSSITGKTKKTF